MRLSIALTCARVLLTSSGVSAHAILAKRLFGLSFTDVATTSTVASTSIPHATPSTTPTTGATSTATTSVVPVTPSTKQKATENKFWQTFEARGVNLGNWLVLERWMDTAYYDDYSSAGTDEWTFCQTLGADRCAEVLAQYWDDWITESDISQVADLGYNLLRIPIGYWALVPTTSDEPYVYSSQLEQMERVMSYASTLGLHVVFDIHGLPGSQNGKEHSGHAGPIDWFSDTNQKRSLSVVTAAMNFIYASPYRSVIAALEIANEPNITTSSARSTYEKYLTSATKIVHSINASMPIMFHDGFQGADSWSKFTKNSKDNYVVDVHEYFTASTSNSISALSGACQLAATRSKSSSKTPVFVGEFSVSVGGVYFDTITWRKQFYETQVQQYSRKGMAGSAFWSIKAFETNSSTTQNNGWSVQALADAGGITSDTWSLSNALTCPSS
ncbi:Probable glucan 1,3-beta-glucosidase A [Taphrina deformans PYCC 5710]|uniref:glucan 1,3-beta-glucosidase n=1 Tax=Taphrina deformans (strain PYCC 5710 / ATCC 11124 / CBS 356.35 / IMI 108563 / JCM 9778 / NBRC 8474) TaxID=1097556 RepID=R4X9S4_TAPDE|nr:Probable glucan 1,3-beta-glucosidase A [Taphrina deformans PYCC 5710]|eukprot:CCG80989.1 Probable glucan 1,3-beta-glucosidase A [Taphrina deformans PYCC 5710]